jgi:hypothetical protein
MSALGRTLTASAGRIPKLEYEQARDELREAKAEADQAYQAIERHEREHGCGTRKATDGQ